MNAVTRCQRMSKLGVLSALVVVGAHSGGPIAAADGAPQAVKTEAERVAFMRTHYAQVLTLHEAVIRGDLAAVTPVARQLAEQEPPGSAPAASAALVAEMRRAARRAVDAETILAAAIATASMLKTCGDCHRSVGTMPAPPQVPQPELGGVVGHMLEHQRAADQMAQGLIVPSNATWRAGAEGFRGAPLHPRALPGGVKLPAQVLASEERIHQLASQAVRAEDPGARAMFYGQILARCADCHAQHKTLWGPSRR
jgi:hypothetical protein